MWKGISGLWLINQTSERWGVVKQADSVPSVPSQKKSQTKEAVKPKEVKKEPKQEAVKPKVQEVVEDEEEAPKPNPKNPLDLLPPSKMILDEWKRLYSNTKANFRELAIKGISSSFGSWLNLFFWWSLSCDWIGLLIEFDNEGELDSMITDDRFWFF